MEEEKTEEMETENIVEIREMEIDKRGKNVRSYEDENEGE